MYEKNSYYQFNQIIAGFEQFLSYYFGFEIKLYAKSNHGKESVIQDCMKIKQKVDQVFTNLGIKSDFPDIDKYYISLDLCVKKYPFINDEIFAEAFHKKDRSTIAKARIKINELLQYDDTFKCTHALVLECMNK